MIQKLMADVFDLGSALYRSFQPRADLNTLDFSQFDMDSMVTDADLEDADRFYKLPDKLIEPRLKLRYRSFRVEALEGSFRSLMTTPFEVNNVVPMRWYRLRGKPGGGPTVILVHGWKMNDFTYFDWYCHRLAVLGISTACLELPYNMRRAPEGTFSGQYALLPNVKWTAAAFRQTIWDILSLMLWLRTQGAGPMGLFGLSVGSTYAAIALCRPEAPEFAILTIPPLRPLRTLLKTDEAEQMKQASPDGSLGLLADPRVTNFFSPENMTLTTNPDKIFIGYSRYDHLVDPDDAEYVARVWGATKHLNCYPTGHINGFVFNLRQQGDIRKFLKQEVL